MREIKFRGKTQDGKWVYGDLIHSGTDTIAILELDAPCFELVVDVVPDTIGQFTGLHDKNGEEIYEGDVVVQYWGFPHYRNGVYYDCNARIGSVVFHHSSSFLLLSGGKLYRLLGDGLTQEVKGNIHDNPNLLTNGRD